MPRRRYGLLTSLLLLASLLSIPMVSAEESSNGAAERHFETVIAPILAEHCLECHDTATHQGGLDLSLRRPAFQGGESGPAIVAGKADESLIWQYVASDDMPADRPPLSAEEKELLRKWLEGGAVYSLEMIDPAVYAHDHQQPAGWIRRLTVDEYIATVRAAVGVDIAVEARAMLPPDLRADGFNNTAYNLNVDLQHVEAYARLAETITSRMDVLEFAKRFSKSQSLSTDDTLRELVEEMGKWLLRGPLEKREVTNYSGIATTVASAGGTFKQAARLIIEAMLQSPRFLYRIEEHPGNDRRVQGFELASRLSYIAWGAPPDEQLLKVAANKKLRTRKDVARELPRLLQDARAVSRSQQFVAQWLNLDRLQNLRPNVERFPDWRPELAEAMQSETLAYAREVLWEQDLPLAALLDSQFTYLTPDLAKHYGIEPAGEGLQRYDLVEHAARGGLLTQGSVLTVGGDEASMVARGLFLMHELMRGVVKDPPPCVDTTPQPSQPGRTQRAIAESRIANSACGGCHSKFEPLAFGLEKFDGLGGYADTDHHGNSLREDGNILFPGQAEPVAYRTSGQLMELLAASPRVQESLTWKLTQFAVGRPLGPSDASSVADIHARAQQDGGTYAATLQAILLSDLVLNHPKE